MTIEPRFQPDLTRGERIIWTGQPDPNRIFTAADWFLVPFSLLWGGFAVYWEATVLGLIGSGSAPPMFAVFGLPFVVLGLYFIVGRFIYQGWVKRRTSYALTNRRALILRETRGRSLDAIDLRAIPSVSVSARTDGSGTVVFGPTTLFDAIYGNTGLSFFRRGSYTPAFFDIPEVQAVADLADLAEEQRARGPRKRR